MNTNENDPINPTGHNQTGTGLTKREYFSAKALQGFCAADYTANSGFTHEYLADWAVNMADALIERLNKPTPF